MKTISACLLVLISAGSACAEWGLYSNRDGKGFVLEKTFAFQKDCEATARALWQAAQQKGAFGCGEYSATSFANRGRWSSPSSKTSPDEQFGEKFRRSEQEQQVRERRAQQEAEWRAAMRAREAAREQARRQYNECMRDRGPC